jgi:hypothetical protein
VVGRLSVEDTTRSEPRTPTKFTHTHTDSRNNKKRGGKHRKKRLEEGAATSRGDEKHELAANVREDKVAWALSLIKVMLSRGHTQERG